MHGHGVKLEQKLTQIGGPLLPTSVPSPTLCINDK